MIERSSDRGWLTRQPCYNALMQPAFVIDVDPSRSYVRVTMSGFFAPADVGAFVAERDRQHRTLRCGPNQHVTLVDIVDMRIQSQESVEEFARMLSNSTMWARKLAFVVDATLARMQAKRATAGRAVHFYRSRQEAEEWLFDDSMAA